MMNFLKIIHYTLDLTTIILFFTYSFIFYYNLELNFIANILIIIVILAIIIKLIYWYIEKKFFYIKNKQTIYLSRISLCVLLYITPLYYIMHHSNLIISNHIKTFSFVIISILAFLSFVVERYVFSANAAKEQKIIQ